MNVSKNQLAEVIVAVVRDALIEGERIDLPGLGTFSVRHIASRVESEHEGVQVMVPPRDVVEFEPRAETS